MRFDFISFLLGFGSASGVSYGLWRYQERLRRVREAAEGQAESARQFLKRTADARYMDDLIEYLEGYHLAGPTVKLSEIVMEPRVIVDKALIAITETDEASEFHYSLVVPRHHDFPEIYTSYSLEHLPIADLCVGAPHVALLGNPGTGKSTALATLALMAMGAISFENLQDLTNRAIEEEQEGLSEAERSRRRSELEKIQGRVMEQFHSVQQSGLDRDSYIPTRTITDLFPIFFHIGSIDLDLSIYGTEVDPAEPIIRAFQDYASLITGQAAPALIYQRLGRGNCLVLIDGFDDLSVQERTRVYPWLQSFMAAYGNNRIIISGPPTNYDPLAHLGFVPMFIRPWTPLETEQYVRKWVALWPTIEARKAGKKKIQVQGVDPKLVQRLLNNNRNRMPLDITLKILAGLAGDEREIGVRGWYERYVRDYLPDDQYSAGLLREVAMVMLDRGALLKQDQIQEIASKRVPATDDKHDATVDQLTKALTNNGIMVKRAGNTYDFRHPLIAAYLGAEGLIRDFPQRLADVAANPNWHTAIAYAASALDLSPAIAKKLSTPPDILFTNLFSIARWLPEAPSDAYWRAEIMKRLSAALLAPTQYPSIRARAVAALIASHDPNLMTIFRQAIRSGNPAIRRMACIGMGALGDETALSDLTPMLVDDNRDVQLAAGEALGAISTEAALEVMVRALLEGEEPLRQVVAQGLGGIPGEGHRILEDAVEHNDMLVRRAAIYGLARIPQPWALLAIYRTMLNDSEWYVRSAAEFAFARARTPEHEAPRSYPQLEQLVWLNNWANAAGVGVPQGDNALQLLVRVLQEGDPHSRVLAARTLGKLGMVKAVKPLYGALMDKDPNVRTAAFEALAMLQLRLMQTLPSVA